MVILDRGGKTHSTVRKPFFARQIDLGAKYDKWIRIATWICGSGLLALLISFWQTLARAFKLM